MKRILIFIALAGISWACGDNADSESNTGAVASASEPEPKPEGPDGEKIYKQYCVVCHGIYGDMGASGAFNLTESELPVEERMIVIKNGRNAMPAFGAILDEDKIKAVAEYTLTLKKE